MGKEVRKEGEGPAKKNKVKKWAEEGVRRGKCGDLNGVGKSRSGRAEKGQRREEE